MIRNNKIFSQIIITNMFLDLTGAIHQIVSFYKFFSYLKIPINQYVVDFIIKLKECEPFTIIYSEIDKFCKELIKKDLISSFEIKYE